MTGWLEILTVAFVAQLAVLPGEKVQFIIAALSTRYRPLVVVAAAGSAFAGWTVLELLFGEALQGAVPPVFLDAVTAGLFLVFAVMLIRSAPDACDASAGAETDDGLADPVRVPAVSIMGHDLRESFGGFVPIFLLMAAGEFGDKTQLVTIGLAVQYGAHPAIWAGEMLAILPVSLLNALVFHRMSHLVDRRRVHVAAAAIFVFFAGDIVLQIGTGVSVWGLFVEGVAGILSDGVTPG